MITWFRVDTMGADGKWRAVMSGLGMTPHRYDNVGQAWTDARTIANEEFVKTRVVKITEAEFLALIPDKPLSRDV